MRKFLIELITSIFFGLVSKLILAARSVVIGVKGEWEKKLKNKAKKDGWNKDNACLPVVLAFSLIWLSGCSPTSMFLQDGQTVMLAQDRNAKVYALASDGSKYKTTVRLKRGMLCGFVDFVE